MPSDLRDIASICDENMATEAFMPINSNDNDEENSASSSEESDDEIPSPSGFADVEKKAAV